MWALPTVAVNIALMTEVSGDVCRGPGLAAYPLLACRAATLVFQVLACLPPTEIRGKPLLLACLSFDWSGLQNPMAASSPFFDQRVLALHVTLDAAPAHPVLMLAGIPPEGALLRLHPHAFPSISAVNSENDARPSTDNFCCRAPADASWRFDAYIHLGAGNWNTQPVPAPAPL